MQLFSKLSKNYVAVSSTWFGLGAIAGFLKSLKCNEKKT